MLCFFWPCRLHFLFLEPFKKAFSTPAILLTYFELPPLPPPSERTSLAVPTWILENCCEVWKKTQNLYYFFSKGSTLIKKKYHKIKYSWVPPEYGKYFISNGWNEILKNVTIPSHWYKIQLFTNISHEYFILWLHFFLQ